MTKDPSFVFNPDMPDQPLTREATLNAQCTDQGTTWTLTLGKGTGRSDELVIDAQSDIPVQAPSITQQASWKIESTFAAGEPSVATQRNFSIASLDGSNTVTNTGSGGGGVITITTIALLVLTGTAAFRRRL